MPRRARLASSLAAAVLVLSACANAVGQGTPAPLASLGPGEGALRLLGVSGYAEDGSIDPRVDWVSAFEHRTGCRVNYTRVATVNAISAALKLRGAGYYDGVVAPPVVAGQLIGARMIAPLNVSLIDGYTTISPALRRQQTVTSHGQTYGIPYLWSSYLLGYRPRSVRPAPRNWTAVFDRRSAVRYAGKIMLPDTPLTMALAALYLKSAKPALGIKELRVNSGTVVFTRQAVVSPKAAAGPAEVKLASFKLSVCDAKNCFPAKTIPVAVTLKVLDGPPLPVEKAYAEEVAKALGK